MVAESGGTRPDRILAPTGGRTGQQAAETSDKTKPGAAPAHDGSQRPSDQSSKQRSAQPQNVTRPIVLVVIGMHRSGTSALGYCLSRLGAALPLHLVGAGAANERGHWEPEKVIALNDTY